MSFDVTFHAIECGVTTCPGYGESDHNNHSVMIEGNPILLNCIAKGSLETWKLPENFTVVTLGRFYPVSFKKRSWENYPSDVDQKITEHALNILDCVQKVDLSEITWQHVKKIIKKSLRKKLFCWKNHIIVNFLYFRLKFGGDTP